jgi:hypothetical protein
MQSPPQLPGNDSEGLLAELKRIRVCTPEEQQEFGRLGRLLVEGGISEEVIQSALGLESVEDVRKAIETGRVTTTRLDRLKELARERLPTALKALKAVEEPAANVDGSAPPATSAGTGVVTLSERSTEQPHGEQRAPATQPARDAAASKDYLSRAQHQRLRDDVERLWATDSRFRNWTLLARAGGLSSGQAMKRAYEVGSSRATLVNLETFSRLHAGFGSKATIALMEGVAVPELRDYLRNQAAERANESQVSAAEPQSDSHADAEAAASPAAAAASDELDADRGERREGGAISTPRVRRTRARGRKKQHLSSTQHQRLRKDVEAIWDRDARLRNWSLLARAAGLRSGFAMKRAYDVNSSVTTARSLSRFGRMLDRFGRAAVDALHEGVPVEGLEAHLSTAMPERAAATAGVRAGRKAAGSGTGGSPAGGGPPGPSGPPSVDFGGMLELGKAIDAEMVRLSQSAEFFDGVANRASLPRIVRQSAARARDLLRSSIGLFAGDGAEPQP